jgi:hypothetical protein
MERPPNMEKNEVIRMTDVKRGKRKVTNPNKK